MKKVADFFCGMGGLSYGFSKYFNLTGYDINKHSKLIFKINKIGNVNEIDLQNIKVNENNGLITKFSNLSDEIDADIIIGGPPCRPWSTVNTTKRNIKHQDFGLVESFLRIINKNKPLFFLMENVPPLLNDAHYNRCLRNLKRTYSLDRKIIQYSEFGAATKRKRLVTYGFLDQDVAVFSNYLEKEKQKCKTVRDAIEHIQNYPKGYKDHVWPNLTTIKKYEKYYKTGKFGWYKLEWDKPAPSFGNVMKTYTLHPDGKRVVSVREVMAIMGFPDHFIFPQGIGHTRKYQMVADTVSPCFSFAVAKIVNLLLSEY